jgi:hypothetical protein
MFNAQLTMFIENRTLSIEHFCLPGACAKAPATARGEY